MLKLAKCFEEVRDKRLMNIVVGRDQKSFLLGCELPFIVTCRQLLIVGFCTVLLSRVIYVVFICIKACLLLEIRGTQFIYRSWPRRHLSGR
jgi:hypothetical protein